jgi:hypothetical protein
MYPDSDIRIATDLSLDVTIPKEDDPVGFLKEIRPIRCQQDRSFSLLQDLENANVEDVIGQVGVEGAERVVEEGAWGLGIDCPSDGETLALSTC